MPRIKPEERAKARAELASNLLAAECSKPEPKCLPFVVYQLVDPRDGKPFYIGSGNRGRPYSHLRDAGAGKRGARLERIREIWLAGHEPKVEILIECESRDWAFANERILIKSTGGLTNEQWRTEKPVVDFLDEFCAAMRMPPEHRRKRFLRLLTLFRLDQCSKWPGYAKLWVAAFVYCWEQTHGKAQSGGSTEPGNGATTH